MPDGLTFHPTRRRYPVIAVKLPVAFALAPAPDRVLADETDAWWRSRIPLLSNLTREQAAASLVEGYQRYDLCINTHSLGLLASTQTMYDALSKLVESAGVGDVGLLSGTGGAEMAIVDRHLAGCPRRDRLDQVIANHGFHGPMEGELSSRVWREDPAPLERLIARVRRARTPPRTRCSASARRASAPTEMRREVLAALPGRRSDRAPGWC